MTSLYELWRRQSDSVYARHTLRGARRLPECRAAGLRCWYAHRLFSTLAVLRMTFYVDGEQATFATHGEPVEVIRAALRILRRDLLTSGRPPETGTPPSGSM